MQHHRYNRRRFVELAGAGIAGACACAPRLAAQSADNRDADLVVFNAKVYTVDSRVPKAEAFAIKAGRFTAVGQHRRHEGADRQSHPDLRRQADDDRAGLHRLPQSRTRHDFALRRPGRQSLRGRVRHHRQHHREAPRQSRARLRRAPGWKDISSTTPRSRTIAS